MAIILHKFRSLLITALAAVILLVAVIFSVFRFALPHITDYGDDIETELSQQLGLKIEIGFIDADMYWFTPRLNLLDVNIYDADGERHFLHFNEVNLSLAWLKTLTELQPALGFISLSGLNLHIERKFDGNLMIQGFEVEIDDAGEAHLPEGIERFLENFSFYLFDSSLHWSDEINNDQRLDLSNINLAMINHDSRHEFSIDMDVPAAYGDHVELKAKIQGPLLNPHQWSAQLYLALENIRLRKWSDDYWRLLDFVASGELDAKVWLDFDQGKLTQINSVINGNDLALHYLDSEVRSWKLQALKGMGKWQGSSQGWKTEIRGLEITRDNRPWSQPGAISVRMDADANEVRARASYLRIEDLMYLTGLLANVLPDVKLLQQTELLSYQPRGDLIGLEMVLPLVNPQHIALEAGFHDVGYQTSNSIPAIDGADGYLRYQNSEAVIKLDSRNVTLDFHDLFRNPVDLQSVYGTVVLYREKNAWHLFANPIDAISPHIHTLSRIDVVIEDNQSPFMNLVTLFSRGDGEHKSLYFPTAIMDKDTVEWLDRSIIKADIPRGGFLYYGTFSDYPFDGNEGVMQALFDIENSTLKYMPDWPALENLKAEVRFHNRSMNITKGQGTIFGARFRDTRVTIADLAHAHLGINGQVDSPLADLLKFIDESPLENTLGSYLTRLQTQGQAKLDIDIQIPIAEDHDTGVSGQLTFNNNEIFLPQENYRFRDVSGELTFTEQTIATRNLAATLDQSAVQLSIVTEAQESENSLHIRAQGDAVPVKSLLGPMPALIDYMDGTARLDVDIKVPLHSDSQQSQLAILIQAELDQAHSSLPGPFYKPLSEPARLDLAIDMLINDGLFIEMDLTDKASLQARRENNRWQVSLDSEVLKGSGFFSTDFALDEPLRLDIDYVNATALITDDVDARKQKITPQQIPPLDINIHMLDWKQWQFRDISLQTRRDKKGMQIDHLELHGPSVMLVGSGSWLTGWRIPNTTTMNLMLQTSNLGDTLEQMDITRSIRNTEGRAEFKWQWNAEPYKFDWDLVEGSALIDLKDGSLSEIEPGAGRLLGLLNFETLLALDFGSQVSRGFAFDTMKGNLLFKTGNAFTDD
ncbi:MAG: hypothetical protein EP315_06280, partial [Gammaproteobacteria bacterium]